ncbi:MAG: 2-C-methyl-D-erythritol 2,4-cyclodiphosphate synthase [Cyanobacteria bacterium HKST-UBA04]|nr:2-C-methyl-D-erythritol 2,4-cyclodiphosphate synthase [Cyanobacteria bacterium HKST-UBA04]
MAQPTLPTPPTPPTPSFRIGQGYDLHRLEAGRPFVLGGLVIDFDKGPVGHSDGDVLLHAATDALLGATGQGDIGQWFPPSDARYKGADSAELLGQVMAQLTQAGWQVVNLDSTVFAEAPKLSPYKTELAQRLAGLLGIDASQINVKAKTMEGLGAIGSQEAIAASVTVLMQQV